MVHLSPNLGPDCPLPPASRTIPGRDVGRRSTHHRMRKPCSPSSYTSDKTSMPCSRGMRTFVEDDEKKMSNGATVAQCITSILEPPYPPTPLRPSWEIFCMHDFSGGISDSASGGIPCHMSFLYLQTWYTDDVLQWGMACSCMYMYPSLLLL